LKKKQKKTQEAQDLRNSQASQKRGYPIAVTDVRSGTEFSFQELSNNDDTAALEGLSSSLQNENFAAEKPYTPKMHDIIAGQFTVDDLWYRAQVIGKSGNDFEVRYLDYGNRETLPVSRIRQLPPDYVTIIDPQAKDAKLYNLKAPALDSEFGRDSMNALREFLWDKVLYAEELRVDKPSGPKGAESKNAASIHHLIVYEEKKDLNKELIRAGHVKVDINSRFKDAYYQTLLNLQEEAHNERLGIWQYGADPEDDEDERL
jgi:staphylococcal nuclease domain-containing protein 1